MPAELVEHNTETNPVADVALNLTALHALHRAASADRSIVLAAVVAQNGYEIQGTITGIEPEARGHECRLHFTPSWDGPASWVTFGNLEYVGITTALAVQDD